MVCGTTSPAEKLHVNGGDIIVENNSSTTVDLRLEAICLIKI